MILSPGMSGRQQHRLSWKQKFHSESQGVFRPDLVIGQVMLVLALIIVSATAAGKIVGYLDENTSRL